MKRLFLMALCAICVLSCEKPGPEPGGNTEEPAGECVIPAEVWAGEDGVIQWDGFKENAALVLVAEDASEFQLTIVQQTSSGVSFSVPADVPEGMYSLVLVQDGRKELGKIKVNARKSPVSGVKVPSDTFPGESISVSGIGFAEGCVIVLVGADGTEHRLETSLTGSGVSAVIPADMEEGVYGVYLLQDGSMWLLSESLEVLEKLVVKTLSAVRYYAPYVGEAVLMREWTVGHEEPVSLKVAEYVVEGDNAELAAYDLYVSDGAMSFVLLEDGFEESNDLAMAYVADSDGNVSQADVLIYGDDEATGFVWTYDEDGFLTDISSSKASFRSFAYQDGNLTEFRNTVFEYDESCQENHPCACDVVWGYMALLEKNDPFVYFPYLLGWYTQASRQLPARMLSPDPSGTGTLTYTLSYEFDEDGYVSAMFWNDGGDSYRVEYSYI